MLSLTNVTSMQASKYYEKDDYYTRSGGEWQGKLTEFYGLRQGVEKEVFDNFINERPERAGFDLCFSAPKSVSLAMIYDDSIIELHKEAVAKTLDRIEENDIYTRMVENYKTSRELTGNMICGKFDHFVSRNQDPQLHTHCVILNQTIRSDGEIRAVDNKTLYHNKMLYGQMYRNEFARLLQEKGYEVEVSHKEKGLFEIKGLSREQIESFSSRRLEILEKLAKWGDFSSEAAELAALKTRDAKQYKDLNILMESWKISLAEQGISKDTFAQEETFVKDEDILAKRFIDGEKQLSYRTFAFEKNDYLQYMMKYGLGYGCTIEDAEKFFEKRLSGEKELLYLGNIGERKYFCSKQGYQIEQSIYQMVDLHKGSVAGVPLEDINGYMSNSLLANDENREQREAVIHISSNTDRFSAVQGLAGTGKTFMLNEARQLLENCGYEVKGIGFTGNAANELRKGAQIQSSTIHSHLNSLEKEAGNAIFGEDKSRKYSWNLDGLKPGEHKQVWFVDEASLVDNVIMKQVMEGAVKKDAKVIFVGDYRQMQPVGAGNSFYNMIEHKKINFVEMSDIKRQKVKSLRVAVLESVKGDVSRSLDLLADKTRQCKIREKRFETMVRDFTGQGKEEREKSMIITGSNGDRKELNEKVRSALKEKGELAEGYKFKVADRGGGMKEKEFSIDEKVMFLRNDKEIGVQNGQTGFVADVRGNRMVVVFDRDESKRHDPENVRIIDFMKYKYVDYGYAMTAHKAQGVTEDKAFINIDTSQRALNSRNSFYVDISRARYDVTVYTDDAKKLQTAVSRFQKKLGSEDFREGSAFEVSASGKGLSSGENWKEFREAYQAKEQQRQKKSVDYVELRNGEGDNQKHSLLKGLLR